MEIYTESRPKIPDIMFVIEITFHQESFHRFTVWEFWERLKSVGQSKRHVIRTLNFEQTAETLVLFDTFPNFHDR